jgi:PAS domain S-box-containing protein
MVLMAWRRIVSFVSLLTAGKTITFEFPEYIALVISVLMLMGVVRIGAYFRSIGVAEEKRKLAEDSLRESEEIFQSFMEYSPIYVFFKDENIRSLRLSRNYETMLNRPLAELLGKSMDELFPAALAKSMVEDDKRIMSEGKTLNIEEELNGRFYQTIKFPININEKPRYLAGFTIDITEHKQAEEALLQKEEFIKNILETVDEGFVIIDPDFRIISANRAYCEQVKSPHCDIFGRHCYEVSHHLGRPCFLEGEECAPSHTFKAGMPYSAIHKHFDSEGNPVHIETKSYPLKDASGNVTAVIETLNNITQQRKLEAQLRHAQKMEAVGTLAGGIAHDFNNILNVIIGYGAMVLVKLEADSPSKGQMNELLAAAERAAVLTKRLLAFSRKQVVEVRPINVNETVTGIRKMLFRLIGENIDFQLHLEDVSLVVMADAGQIEQVLMNLASNAKDAMPEGGRLTIGTGLQEIDDEFIAINGYGKPGMYVLITVADTGCGMDAETQKKIFEPFFTTKAIGEGTGLGLAISYGIIKQHSGYIKVYSEQGKGTVFKIYLPLIEEAALPDRTSEAPIAIKGGNETVLVAEDDASLRKLTRIVLESFGYSVITAEDGEEAIAKFMENREKIHLVILDMIMPKKNGKEVSEALRKAGPRTKILFVSGYTMDIIKNRELTEFGFDFIHKPVRPQDLLIKVREVLDK